MCTYYIQQNRRQLDTFSDKGGGKYRSIRYTCKIIDMPYCNHMNVVIVSEVDSGVYHENFCYQIQFLN